VLCVLGLDACPNFRPGHADSAAVEHQGQALPWSGLALGLEDLPAVAALGRLHFVALIGAANAGKTTLLAAHWLAIRRGTLGGWHRIARHLQWVPYGRGFPRSRVGMQLEDVIGGLNLFLRGWGNYFRTGNASDKFVSLDRHVAWRLKRLLIKQRGRNLRAGQAGKWTPAWFHDQGLHQLMGTIRYPKTA
jgi:hypothetical protein